MENSMKLSQYDSLTINAFEEEKVSVSSETLDDAYKNKENEVSSGQSVNQSLAVASKAVNDFEVDENSHLLDHLSKPASSLSSSTPEGPSMISYGESSSCVPRESIRQFKVEKPIVNDMPIREETTSSTVVSVSPELDRPFSSVTLSRTCDLGTCSRSNGESNNSGATIEENTNTRESSDTASLPRELSQTPEVIERPSVVKDGDDLEAGASIREYSVAEQNTDEERPM